MKNVRKIVVVVLIVVFSLMGYILKELISKSIK